MWAHTRRNDKRHCCRKFFELFDAFVLWTFCSFSAPVFSFSVCAFVLGTNNSECKLTSRLQNLPKWITLSLIWPFNTQARLIYINNWKWTTTTAALVFWRTLGALSLSLSIYFLWFLFGSILLTVWYLAKIRWNLFAITRASIRVRIRFWWI